MIIPVGTNKWGWKKFLSILSPKLDNKPTDFTSPPTNPPKIAAIVPKTNKTAPPTYKAALNTQRVNHLKVLVTNNRDNKGKEKLLAPSTSANRINEQSAPAFHTELFEELAYFTPELSVIVYRANFHDRWAYIINEIRDSYPFVKTINPLQSDCALLTRGGH